MKVNVVHEGETYILQCGSGMQRVIHPPSLPSLPPHNHSPLRHLEVLSLPPVGGKLFKPAVPGQKRMGSLHPARARALSHLPEVDESRRIIHGHASSPFHVGPWDVDARLP